MSKKNLIIIFTSLCLLQIVAADAQPTSTENKVLPTTKIILPKPSKFSQIHSAYFPTLIRLALQKTENTDGPFIIEESSAIFTSNRMIAELSRNNLSNKSPTLSIMWTSTSRDREQKMLPIKISILRGLNSYRIFLIRKEDQNKFHSVRNLHDLSQFTAGQGAQWPDTQIMTSNGLPVIGAADADLLFTMLASKRFDYFPRGLYEVWNEQKVNADKNLIIEDSILLHYSAPIYFFVNRNNAAFANRLERGLRIAIQDGSFEKLFLSIPSFKQGFDEMQNSSRHRIDLLTDESNED